MITNMFTCYVPGVPIPQGSKGATKTGRMFESNKRTGPWRDQMTAAFRTQLAMYEMTEPLAGPVVVVLRFHMPRPANHYGTGKNAGVVKDSAPYGHAVKPDADKLTRAVFDSLTKAGVWEDDSRAWSIQVSKVYCDRPDDAGVLVELHTTD